MPGNSPALIQSSVACGADVVVLDLEDSVHEGEKDAARELVCQAARFIPWEGVELAVRVNPLSTRYGEEDLFAVVRAGIRLIRYPKVETPEDMVAVDGVIRQAERSAGQDEGTVRVIASIETAKGLVMAAQVAMATSRLDALSLGGEDLSADLGAERTAQGDELLFARLSLVAAARAAGLMAIDSVFSRVEDDTGLLQDAVRARRLGFDGKSVVSPRQVRVVREAFMPEAEEIEQAKRVLCAAREAAGRGSGVSAVDGTMVDQPVVRRARRVLAMAGLLEEEA